METTRSTEVLRYMRDILSKRTTVSEEEGAESGFTLIELMVVLLIMAILLAIAIPTFLGVKSGAQDRAAQSNLTTAMTSAKAAYANAQSYSSTASMVTALNSQEPEMTFQNASTTSSTSSNQISVSVLDAGQTLMLATYSQASGNGTNVGTCWGIADNESNATTTGLPQGVSYSEWNTTTSSCAALNSGTVKSAWVSSYPTTKGTTTAP